MFKRKLYEIEDTKYYRQGFLDGINFTTALLKQNDYQETLTFLKQTLDNLDYYAKKYHMNKRILKKNTEVLIYNIEYFYEK